MDFVQTPARNSFPRASASIAAAALWFFCLSAVTGTAQEMFAVIDPGHGGKAPSGSQAERTLSSPNNARAPSGLLEKDLTLELAFLVAKKLEELREDTEKPQVRAVLTRRNDTNPDFAERARIAAETEQMPIAIVSIHFNALDGQQKGTLCMISSRERNPNYVGDEAFARELSGKVSEVVARYVSGSRVRPVIDDGHLHGGKGSNFFYQLAKRRSLDTVPQCFLEVEFIDSEEAETKLLAQKSKTFEEIAEAIARVIMRQAGRSGSN